MRGLLVPGRCAERRHHHGLVGTSTAASVEAEPAAYLTRIQNLMSKASWLAAMPPPSFIQLVTQIGRRQLFRLDQLDGTNRSHNPATIVHGGPLIQAYPLQRKC